MNLAEQLDEAIGKPRPDRSAVYFVASGRRAQRRRRFAVSGGTVALVLTSGLALALPHETEATAPDTSVAAAKDPIPGVAETSGPTTEWSGTQAARYDAVDGTLVIRPGWRVTQRVEAPFTAPENGKATLPDKSVALALTDGRSTQWALLNWYAGDGESGTTWNDEYVWRGFLSLADWVDFEMAFKTRRSTDQAVGFAPDGTLDPRNGAVIRGQGPVDLGNGETAVGVRIDLLHNQWWILARQTPKGPTYVPLPYPGEDDPNTVAGFERYVRALVAAGDL